MAVVVAQLAEWLLPIPEVSASNPVVSKMVHPTFTDKTFSRPFFTDKFSKIFASFTDKCFSQWLHQNNLCCESIAQDGMRVLRIFFAMATSK